MRPHPIRLKHFLLTPLILCTFDPSTSVAATVQGNFGVSTTGYVQALHVSTTTLSATTITTSAPLSGNSTATKDYVDAAVSAAGTTTAQCEVKSASNSSAVTAPACSSGFTETWGKSGQGCTEAFESNVGGSGLDFWGTYLASGGGSKNAGVGRTLIPVSSYYVISGVGAFCYNGSSYYWAFRVCCK